MRNMYTFHLHLPLQPYLLTVKETAVGSRILAGMVSCLVAG